MEEDVVEVRGGTARQLNEIAEERGLTLQELVTHILLDYLEKRCELGESEVDDESDDDDEG